MAWNFEHRCTGVVGGKVRTDERMAITLAGSVLHAISWTSWTAFVEDKLVYDLENRVVSSVEQIRDEKSALVKG